MLLLVKTKKSSLSGVPVVQVILVLIIKEE